MKGNNDEDDHVCRISACSSATSFFRTNYFVCHLRVVLKRVLRLIEMTEKKISESILCPHVAFERRRRRSLPSKKALMFRVFHALLPLRHALLPRPLMISTRNF